MNGRTPVTLITGPLGSGKTTLVRSMLDQAPKRIAVLMNEFGEIGIDGAILAGRNVHITELDGGCVCCSLIGEFRAAVDEIIERVDPEQIVVETTGVAEPDALILDIEESMPQVRLDGVVMIADADAMMRFPSLGITSRLQIEAADFILLNKVDLITADRKMALEEKIRKLNPAAPVAPTSRCRIDLNLIFGMGRGQTAAHAVHVHQPGFESLDYRTERKLERACFERFVESIREDIYRAKGFVRFTDDETSLFNLVAGRWDLEGFEYPETVLVFIGQGLHARAPVILDPLKGCER
ncbi:MAG: GTP-binding protein [Desulfobacteraceae bacterium]|nr:MAG: GTP-binding protein [Desulfobacteraceae bacterium]